MFRTADFPVYRQLDQMDCGPTCLKIITDYYGKDFSLDYLREISFLQKGGVSLAGLSQALETIGLSSLAIKTDIGEMVKDVPLPAIAHWEGSHFVVVYKINGKKVFISDPAIGRMEYYHSDFLQKWSDGKSGQGILLLVESTPDFSNIAGEVLPAKGFGFLYKYLEPYRKYFGQILLGLFIASIIQLILPFLTQSLIDYGIHHNNLSFIYLIVMAQLLLFFTLGLTEVIREWLLLHLNTRMNVAMISDFLDKLLLLPISYFDSKTTGDFMQRINDHHRIDEFLGSRFLTIIFDVFSILVFGLVLSLFHTGVFLIFFIGTCLFIVWSLLFMKKKEILDHQLFDIKTKEQSIFLQIFKAILEIKLNGSESRRKDEWKNNQLNFFRVHSSFLRIDQAQINGGSLINEFSKILIIFWSAKAVISGEITLGTMLAIQFIVGSLSIPIANSIDFLVGLQRAILSLNRLSEIHNQEAEEKSRGSLMKITPGDITISNLSFGYGPGHDGFLIKDINVSIPVGKITAIVGPSGSGKTTFLKLLLRLYQPNKGRIMIGEDGMEDVDLDHWRKMCGTVLQEGVLFNDTIEQNITESASQLPYDRQRLVKAVKMANLEELIGSLPLGFRTKIGEQGQLLSGGEKQRLLIARAIYKNPAYLFFDEATSSLDAENEKVITENLTSFYRNKTVVIVAHRLSTVKHADQILVMDKGAIVEQGNHRDLISREGIYSKLIRNQL